jgi:hypothetical protein
MPHTPCGTQVVGGDVPLLMTISPSPQAMTASILTRCQRPPSPAFGSNGLDQRDGLILLSIKQIGVANAESSQALEAPFLYADDGLCRGPAAFAE